MLLKIYLSIFSLLLFFSCSKQELPPRDYLFSPETEGVLFERVGSLLLSPDNKTELYFDMIKIKSNEKAAENFNQGAKVTCWVFKKTLIERGWQEDTTQKQLSSKRLRLMIDWNSTNEGVIYTDWGRANITRHNEERIQRNYSFSYVGMDFGVWGGANSIEEIVAIDNCK
jgi:hypothetical protein